jgi:predicted DNA binding CopG/RHH family protein
MKKEYDLSKLKSRKNPYAKLLKKQVTMRLSVHVIEYFKKLAEESGIPYQNLIDFYLQECVESQRRPSTKRVS